MYTQKNIFSKVFFKGPAPNQKFPKWASRNRELPKWASPNREFPKWASQIRNSWNGPAKTGIPKMGQHWNPELGRPISGIPDLGWPISGIPYLDWPFQEVLIWCWPIKKLLRKCGFFRMFSTPMCQFLVSNSSLLRWHAYSAKKKLV